MHPAGLMIVEFRGGEDAEWDDLLTCKRRTSRWK